MDAKVAECKERMHKAVVHLQEEFSAVRTGRASPSLIERVMVEAYGTLAATACGRPWPGFERQFIGQRGERLESLEYRRTTSAAHHAVLCLQLLRRHAERSATARTFGNHAHDWSRTLPWRLLPLNSIQPSSCCVTFMSNHSR